MASAPHDAGASPKTPPATVRWVRLAESAVAVLCRIAVGLAALQLMAIFALISYAVAMRYLVGLPQPWIDEAAGWLLVGSVMLAIPEVQRRGDHIGIDFLARKLGPRRSRALLVFAVLTVLASAAVFVREGIVMVEFSRMLNVLSNRLPDVPLWMVQSLVPAGFALLALVALVQLACLLLGLKPRDMAEAADSAG